MPEELICCETIAAITIHIRRAMDSDEVFLLGVRDVADANRPPSELERLAREVAEKVKAYDSGMGDAEDERSEVINAAYRLAAHFAEPVERQGVVSKKLRDAIKAAGGTFWKAYNAPDTVEPSQEGTQE